MIKKFNNPPYDEVMKFLDEEDDTLEEKIKFIVSLNHKEDKNIYLKKKFKRVVKNK